MLLLSAKDTTNKNHSMGMRVKSSFRRICFSILGSRDVVCGEGGIVEIMLFVKRLRGVILITDVRLRGRYSDSDDEIFGKMSSQS